MNLVIAKIILRFDDMVTYIICSYTILSYYVLCISLVGTSKV